MPDGNFDCHKWRQACYVFSLALFASAMTDRVCRSRMSREVDDEFSFRITGFVRYISSTDDSDVAAAISRCLDLPPSDEQITGNSLFEGVVWGKSDGQFALCLSEVFMEPQRALSARAISCAGMGLNSNVLVAGQVASEAWFGFANSAVEVFDVATSNVQHQANLAHARWFFDAVVNSITTFSRVLPLGARPIITDDGVRLCLTLDSGNTSRQLTIVRAFDSSLPANVCVIVKNLATNHSVVRALSIDSHALCHVPPRSTLRLPSGAAHFAEAYRDFPQVPRLSGIMIDRRHDR